MRGTPLKPLTRSAEGRRVYLIAGLGGHVLEFRPHAKELRKKWQLTGIEYPYFVDGTTTCGSIEELALTMAIPLKDDEQCIVIVGYSVGGAVAYQMATEMQKSGKRVAVVLIDTRVRRLLRKRGRLLRGLRGILIYRPVQLYSWAKNGFKTSVSPPPEGAWRSEDENLTTFVKAHIAAARRYQPQKSDVPVVLIRAHSHRQWRTWVRDNFWPSKTHGWKRVCRLIATVPGPGTHFSIVRKPHVAALSISLDRALETAFAALSAKGQSRVNKDGAVRED